MPQHLFSWTLASLLLLATTAHAQLGAYNPYANPEDDLPPVAADGTLNWPTFYKDWKLESKYERLWSLGACRGTNMAIQMPVEKNKVNVNKLPTRTMQGQVVRITPGVISILGPDQRLLTVAMHPAGVSKLVVVGDMPLISVRPGMIVRFVGEIDERAKGLTEIAQLEVFSLPADFRPQALQPKVRDTVVARVVRVNPETIALEALVGKFRRLTFPLADKVGVHVNGTEVGLIAVGDQLSSEGRYFENGSNNRVLFASKIDVTKGNTATIGNVAQAP